MPAGASGSVSGVALAVNEVTREKGKVFIVSGAATSDLTGAKCSPNTVHWTYDTYALAVGTGRAVVQQGGKSWFFLTADYAFGYEVIGGFQQAFEDCGGKIIQKIWVPLGNKDFGPYLPQIKRNADAVFTLMVGPMSLAFPKQYKAAGLKMPLLGGGTSADEFILPFMGDEAIGYTTALQYSAAIQTAKNEAFVKKYRKLYGKVPSYYSETNYTTAEWIDKVMAETHGQWPGTKKFIQLFSKIKLDSVRGPVRLDSQRNPIENIYIRRVEKTKMFGYPNDELWNVVVKTYPDVTQYGSYDKAKYLAQPPYAGAYPPCRDCSEERADSPAPGAQGRANASPNGKSCNGAGPRAVGQTMTKLECRINLDAAGEGKRKM